MRAKKELYRLRHDDKVYCVSFHNDLIISASRDKTTRIWKKSTGEKLHSLVQKGGCVNFDISPSGVLMAVAHTSGITIWSLSDYNKVAEFELGLTADVRFQTDHKIVAALTN